MAKMLDGLSEATRLTDTARKSTEQAVIAANETAAAVRETTRTAVFEAKRAAQAIRAETQALQDAAADTLQRLQGAAQAARVATTESQAAADTHALTIEKRLSALAAAAGGRTTPAPAPQVRIAERPVERIAARKPEPVRAQIQDESLYAAANAAVSRGAPRKAEEPRKGGFAGSFKGFGAWGNFTPAREETPTPSNDAFDLVDFGTPAKSPDSVLQADAIDIVLASGVNLDIALAPRDLEAIARNSRNGATARRQAVTDAAPAAVSRVARHIKRHATAQKIASDFRSRPDLAKSRNKAEGADLVCAYLLIDAALA
jgi:hypothetical protein